MSYRVQGFKTKQALKDAVAERGADKILVTGTSLFGDEDANTVADLADTNAVIVGPDAFNDRRWYANVKTKKDGTIYVT